MELFNHKESVRKTEEQHRRRFTKAAPSIHPPVILHPISLHLFRLLSSLHLLSPSRQTILFSGKLLRSESR